MQVTSRRTAINNKASLNGDRDRAPVRSGSRDQCPIIRHDFVSSPWKRFRPSADDVGQPRRRPPFKSSRNLCDFSVTDVTEDFPAIPSKVSCRPLVARASCPGITLNADMASCTNEHHHLHLASNAASNVNVDDLPVTSSRHVESRRRLNARSRCPGFSIKADFRFDMASSTGQHTTSLHFFVVFNSCGYILEKSKV